MKAKKDKVPINWEMSVLKVLIYWYALSIILQLIFGRH